MIVTKPKQKLKCRSEGSYAWKNTMGHNKTQCAKRTQTRLNY